MTARAGQQHETVATQAGPQCKHNLRNKTQIAQTAINKGGASIPITTNNQQHSSSACSLKLAGAGFLAGLTEVSLLMRYGQATQTQLERAPRTPSHGWLSSSKAERQGRAESVARQDERYHQSGSKIIGPTSPFSPPSLAPPPLRRVPVSGCFRPALGFLGPAPPGPGPCSLPPPPLFFVRSLVT